MSDANRTSLRAVKETAFRLLPNNPTYQDIRFNSESISYTPTTEVSNELDATRQVSDLILTGFDAGGDISTEYSIENLDLFLEGAFCSPWQRTPEVYNGTGWEYGATATRITATSATTITLAATSVLSGSIINATGTAFVAGHLIRVTGSTVAGVNGLFAVSGSAATSITIAGGAVDAAPAATTRVKVVGVQGASGDIVATTTGGSALTSTTLNWTTVGLMVGQWVKISSEGGAFSFATAANNVYARVSAISAQRLSFDIVVGTGFAADVGTGKTIRVYFGDTLRTGTSEFSYRIEKQYALDAGTRYSYFRGMEVATMAFNGDTRAVLTATLSFVGSDSTGFTVSRDSGATTINASSGNVLDSSNSIPWLLEGGSTVSTPNYVSSFTFSLENNLRAQNAIGSPGAVGIGQGRSNFTGSLNTYFGDETMLNKLITNTASSAAFAFRDSSTSKAEIWDVPRLKYSTGVPEITGIDTDIFANLSFQALRDSLNGRDYTVMLSRFDYVL